jgi:mono/diheme cytochrome c family protein
MQEPCAPGLAMPHVPFRRDPCRSRDGSVRRRDPRDARTRDAVSRRARFEDEDDVEQIDDAARLARISRLARIARVTRIALVPWTIALSGCHHGSVPLPTSALAVATGGDTTGLVARGEYIVRTVAVCGGCHAADPAKDVDGPLSGGLTFKDWRLGTIRASNLTPDSATGLGAWSDAEIVRALRNGEARDGRLLAPVMPYEWLHDMSDRDALAVARYLKSRPAVPNVVHENPDVWFKLGRSLFLGPKHGTAASAPPRDSTAAYGGYLAQHVGLCAECHTPRHGAMSKPDRHRLFAGSAHPPKDFPENPANLTPDSATGIGRWSEADFVRTLRTGVDPKGDSLHAFMPWRQIRRMSDDDLRAIYHFLRALPPIRNAVPMRAHAHAHA